MYRNNPTLTKEEQETIILWNNADDTCRISTCDRRLISRMTELSAKDSSIDIVHSEKDYGVFNCPKSYIKVNIPRQLSDEQKTAMAERAKINLVRKDKENDDT